MEGKEVVGVSSSVCMCVYVYVCVYVCVLVYMCVLVYVCVYVSRAIKDVRSPSGQSNRQSES